MNLTCEYGMVVKIENTKVVESLFEGWNETLIWSCLDKTMGEIYANSLTEPTCALAVLGEFMFFAGTPNKELITYKPSTYQATFVLIATRSDDWWKLIEEAYEGRNSKLIRYAIKKEKNVFNRNQLEETVKNLPKGYEIKLIDETLYNQCKQYEWSKYFVSNYSTYSEFERMGLGFIVLHDGEMCSGASSYSSYQGGIEIEIDTVEEHRRKGLAFACVAKLILACLDKGLYPSWDAANKESVHIAEKLGYHFDHEYVTYSVWNI